MCTETMTLHDYIRHTQPAILDPADSVSEALHLMERRHIHAVMVCKNGTLKGLFTMGDYIRRVAEKGRTPKFTPLAEVMTPDPHCFSPGIQARKAFEIMTRRNISHAPVTRKDNQPLGMVSKDHISRDIYRDLQEKSEECHWLKTYISGEPYALCA